MTREVDGSAIWRIDGDPSEPLSLSMLVGGFEVNGIDGPDVRGL